MINRLVRRRSFFDVSSTIRRSRSYRHLEGIKPKPKPNTNTKLLEPAKYHFPNGECLGASICRLCFNSERLGPALTILYQL